MSYYVNMFFYTELTCIPQLLDKYIGKYYNNAIGNALMWVLLMWLFIHYLFDTYLNILMKKMHYKSYKRKRLLSSLWFAGFYGTGFLYCLATIVKNNVTLLEYRNNIVLDGGIIPLHILMGLGLMGTFFFQSCIWSLFNDPFDYTVFTHFALTVLSIATFYSRRVELFLSLVALTCFCKFIFNVTRCLACSLGKGREVFIKGILYLSIGLSILVHAFIIPLLHIVPLIYSLCNGVSINLIVLLTTIVTWWIGECIANPTYKYVDHWLRHSNINNPKICPGSSVECTLFPIRDDLCFDMNLIKEEIQSRKDSMIAKRKTKNRGGTLVQVLKCMVAIKRKLKNKRPSADPGDSDSETENSEDKESSSSSEDESSGSDDLIKKEYQEETARALIEDQEHQSSQDESVVVSDDKKNS